MDGRVVLGLCYCSPDWRKWFVREGSWIIDTGDDSARVISDADYQAVASLFA